MKKTQNHLYRNFGSNNAGESRLVFVAEKFTEKGPSPTGFEKKEKEKVRRLDVSSLRLAYEAEKSKRGAMETQLLQAMRSEKMEKEKPENQLTASDLETMAKEIEKNGKLSEKTKTLISNKIRLIDAWLAHEVKKPIFNSTNEKEYPEEAAIKKTIRDLLDGKYEKQLLEERKAKQSFEPAAQRTFREYGKRVEGYIATGNALETLTHNPRYETVRKGYESAVNGLILKSPEFAIFRETNDHIDSSRVATEYRQLFLSLMYTETDNFKTDFTFGKGFGNDPEKNKANYPDLYEIWIKNNGGMELFERKGSLSQQVSRLKSGLTQLSTGISGSPELNNLKVPDIATADPTTLENADQNIKDIKSFLHTHRDKRGRGSLGAFDKNYEQDQKTLDQLLELAEQQKKQIIASEALKAFEGGFKASELEGQGNQQKAMEMCLQKFKKAQEIVDGIWKDSNLSGTYNPEVKRMLIAQIYKNGVSGFEMRDGKPAFKDYTPYYSSVLRMIANSGHFNQNLSTPLSVEKVEFLAIAVKNGLEMAKLDEIVRNQRQDTSLNTAEAKKALSETKSPVEFPEPLRKLFDAKKNGGDVSGAVNGLPENYKRLLDNVGNPKNNLSELRKALFNNEVEKLAALSGQYGNWLNGMTRVEMDKIIQDIDSVGSMSAPQTLPNPAIGNYVANEIKLRENEALASKIEAYLKNPDAPDSQTWITAEREKVRGGKEVGDAHSIGIVYKTMELHGRGQERMMANVMDIEFRGIYESYQKEMAKNPRLATANWTELFQSNNPEDRKALIELLKKIIPQGKEGGKEDFIFMLESMENEDLLKQLGRNDVEKNDPKATALSMLGLIKAQIEKEEKKTAATKTKELEYASRLEGKTLTDYVTDTIGTTWQMAVGPGNKPAERIAAIFLFYMAFKMGSKAFGEHPGTTGNLMRLGLGTLAADMIAKRISGKGLIERLNAHNIANSFEGTDVAALVKHSREIADSKEIAGISINEEQQHEALSQMKKVPFRKLVEWYKSVEVSKNNLKPAKGQTDLFKALRPAISTTAIFEHGKHPNLDADLVGRVAIYKMMKGLFDYAGNQDGIGKDADQYGLRSLEARWVQPLEPKGTAEVAGRRYTRWMPPESLLKDYRGNPDKLTWETVMNVEITLSDALQTVDDNWMDQSVKMAERASAAAAEVVRVDILPPTRAKVEEYMDKARYEWGPEAKKWIGDLADAGATKAYFVKERLVLEYGAHKVEIGRMVDKHVELAKRVIPLPFELIVAVDNWAIDFGNTSLNKLLGILKTKYGEEIPVPLMEQDLDSGLMTNPTYRSYFGEEYADHFAEAVNDPNHLHIDESGVSATASRMLNETIAKLGLSPGDANRLISQQNSLSKIGPIAYYVSEVGIGEVPVAIQNDPYKSTLFMKARAEEKARNELKKALKDSGKDISKYDDAYFDKFLYSITDVSKVGKGGPGQPEKFYSFYRMPLAESMEVFRKNTGKWMDSEDPRNLKDYPPFIADPEKGTIMNLVSAFGRNLDTIKPLAKYLGIPSIQALRLITNIMGAIRSGVNARKYPGLRDFLSNFTLSEDQKVKLDEMFGTAAFEMWALSAKYGSGEIVDKKGTIKGKVDSATAEKNRLNYERPMPVAPPKKTK